jgi:ankyrin repeat protein
MRVQTVRRFRGLAIALTLMTSCLITAISPKEGHAQMTGSGQDLLAAATSGKWERVAALIGAGAPLDLQDSQGRTALLLAVADNRIEIARALIAAGASVNVQAANLDTPWLLAGARGRTEIVQAMIPAGPDLSIRNRYGGNALIPACERAHIETIALLLTTAIDVDHVNNLGWTCLLEIVLLGDGGPRHQEAARLILNAKADPNLADKAGVTPLAHARSRGQSEIAALLESAGGRLHR